MCSHASLQETAGEASSFRRLLQDAKLTGACRSGQHSTGGSPAPRRAIARREGLRSCSRGFRVVRHLADLVEDKVFHPCQQEPRAQIFVAVLAVLLRRLLSRRLKEAGIEFSTERAMEALSTVRLVTVRLGDQPEHRAITRGCPDARRLLEALKVTDLKPPPLPKGKSTSQ